jgi:hypothetical protein
MDKATLTRIENNADTKIFNCFGKEIFTGINKEATEFIHLLIAKGIPLSAINVNDFNSSLKPAIYITREYGRNNGGKSKRYIQWNNRTADYAVSFYNAK